MENNTSRIIIETIVKRTLKNIKDAPDRSIRNLIDMALHFSGGRFQRNFFEIAQTMLENENSPYYGLIEDVVTHIDDKSLLRFGMNVGYNSCTIGAKKIREIEKKRKLQYSLDHFFRSEYPKLFRALQQVPVCHFPGRNSGHLYLASLSGGKFSGSIIISPGTPGQCFSPVLQSPGNYPGSYGYCLQAKKPYDCCPL